MIPAKNRCLLLLHVKSQLNINHVSFFFPSGFVVSWGSEWDREDLWAGQVPSAGHTGCRHHQPPSPAPQNLSGAHHRLRQSLLAEGKTPYAIQSGGKPIRWLCALNLVTIIIRLSSRSHLWRFCRGWSNLEGSHKVNTSTSRWWRETN